MMHQATLLQVASLDTSDFDRSLQQLVRLDADALAVERVNYWSLRPGALVCELGYLRGLRTFERGVTITSADYPRYFEALRQEQVIAASDARRDVKTAELTERYLTPLGITSMMDIPVWVRGRLVGVLCHEHVGTKRQWTSAERSLAISVAQAIASAIEARERRRVEREGGRASFLAEATVILTESLDVEAIPERLVGLAIPILADWCVLDVVGPGGALSRRAMAHADPKRKPALDELSRRYPPTREGPQPSARAISGRRTLFVPEASEQVTMQYCVDRQHCEIVMGLGLRALMCIPLKTRGRILGAITLIGVSRTFDHEDLRLGEELARRAAIALDNARLHREAQEAIALRDEFLSVAAHELYTPLTSLALAAAELERAAEPRVQRAVGVVTRSTARLTRLVDELLDASRAGLGAIRVHRRTVDLADVARDVIEQLRDEAGRAGSAISLEAPAAVEGCWDPARIAQLLANLLMNALKFGAGKPIEVAVGRDPERAHLTVRDHGCGIEPDKLAHIFDRFERGVSRRQYGGLGLGLYIARGIAEAHGGTILARSSPGQGATFDVELPLAR